MLRIGVPAAIHPHKKATARSFDSIFRANKHGGRFIFLSSSKSQATQERPRRASSTDLVSKEEGAR
jgi:hypothetical protein